MRAQVKKICARGDYSGIIGKTLNSLGTSATGAHSIFSVNKNMSNTLFNHEATHLWHSRALNDNFLLNYFIQGGYPALMGKDQYYGNYFEEIAEYGF